MMRRIQLEDVLAVIFVTAFSFAFACIGIAALITAINGGL